MIPLLENTTYAIDFGSAIRDNNEGNPLNAMRYVFSTGDKVDSIMCSGYTADSYKADSVSRTFIWFYIADSLPQTPGYDSTIFNRKPDVIARAQNNGIFIAQNLKPVNYRIYAFGDKNDNQLYEAGTDLVGILDTVYNPAKLPEFAIWFDSLRMYPSAEPQLYFRMFTDKAFVNQRLVDATRPAGVTGDGNAEGDGSGAEDGDGIGEDSGNGDTGGDGTGEDDRTDGSGDGENEDGSGEDTQTGNDSGNGASGGETTDRRYVPIGAAGGYEYDEDCSTFILVPEGAVVLIDGISLGAAPVEFEKILGTYTVTLRKDGNEKEYTVTVEDDGEDVYWKFPMN